MAVYSQCLSEAESAEAALVAARARAEAGLAVARGAGLGRGLLQGRRVSRGYPADTVATLTGKESDVARRQASRSRSTEVKEPGDMLTFQARGGDWCQPSPATGYTRTH